MFFTCFEGIDVVITQNSPGYVITAKYLVLNYIAVYISMFMSWVGYNRQSWTPFTASSQAVRLNEENIVVHCV